MSMYNYILNIKPNKYLDDYDEYVYDDITTLDDLQIEKLVREYNKEKEE